MLEIKVPMCDLQPGDKYKLVHGNKEFVVDKVDIVDYIIYSRPSDTFCSHPNVEVILISTERDISERIVEELDKFPAEVRKHIANFYCRECGERACGIHR